MKRVVAIVVLTLAFPLIARSGEPTTRPSDARFEIGELVFSEDFTADSGNWISELEPGGKVQIGGGEMDIDVPGGCTVWFKPRLSGPVMIEYQATLIGAGGANDRVSDLNCFWMARDSRSPDDLFATRRSGKFADYDRLLTYYASIGGNGNTTTRFRRYTGEPDHRPLLPQHDRREPLNRANATRLIQLIACGKLIQFYCDGVKLFELEDADPYTGGHFGFRTTKNHMKIRQFRLYRLRPNRAPPAASARGQQ